MTPGDGYQAFARRMGARGADADAMVAIGERGGVPLYLSWVRAERRYARASLAEGSEFRD